MLSWIPVSEPLSAYSRPEKYGNTYAGRTNPPEIVQKVKADHGDDLLVVSILIFTASYQTDGWGAEDGAVDFSELEQLFKQQLMV